MSARERGRRPSRGTGPAGSAAGPAAPGRRGEAVLLAAIAACLLLRAVGSLTYSSWAWGLNTLRDWPWPWPVVLPALAALAFVPAVARLGARVLDRVGDGCADAAAGPRLLAAAAVALCLFLLRDPLLFTGDSGLRLTLLSRGANLAELMPQLSLLDLWVNVAPVRWLMRAGLPALTAIRLVSALQAGAFTLGTFAFLRAAGARGAAWVATAVLILGSGCLTHFLSYGKYGPLLVGLVLAATGAVRMVRTGRGAWWLAAGLAVALAAHRSAYALLPAAGWAMAVAWRDSTGARRRHLALAGVALAAVAVALLPKTVGVLLHYDLAVNVVGSATEGRIDPVRQIANVVNVLFLLSPLWPAGLIAAGLAGPSATSGGTAPATPGPAVPAGPRGRGAAPAASGSSLAWVGGLAVLAELAVMLVTRGRQGPLRDWDNQTGPALVVTLACAGALLAVWRRIGTGRTAGPVVACAAVAGLALWGIQVSPGIGERRVATLLADRAAWNREEWARAAEFVGNRAFESGRYEAAAHAYEIAAACAPSPRMVDNLAISLGMAGRREEAQRALVRAMSMPQGSATMWAALGCLALNIGDTTRAIICADSALAREPRLARAARVAPAPIQDEPAPPRRP